ncbi:MAG: hypothetical protein EOP09_11680, partial [Proteobacteria bacterium]
MRTALRNNILKGTGALVGAGLLVFAFQNCGKAGFDQAIDESSTGTVDAKSAAAPFAYDATFDQITYNSCAGAGATNKPGFFTIKAGAYANGGVAMRPEFLAFAKSNLKPVYPATDITVEQLKAFVAGTSENVEATLQMSIRTRGAPTSMLTANGSVPAVGLDFTNLMSDLTDDRIMEPIFRGLGAPANYFPLAVTSAQKVMEASINYNKDIGMAYSVRNELTNSRMLSLTYTGFRGSAFSARVPAGNKDQTIAYGKGYLMEFAAGIAPYSIAASGGNAAVRPADNNPANILNSIREIDLLNPASSTGAVWSCPEARRYVIMRTQDAALCPADSFDRLADAGYRAELEIIRRHLRPDQWDIGVDARCVVPKSGSCYMSNTGAEEPVQYNQGALCYYGVA